MSLSSSVLWAVIVFFTFPPELCFIPLTKQAKIVLILLKKINVNKFTLEYNSNRILCSSCTKYCTFECNDDPPSYQLFEPPSYEEING